MNAKIQALLVEYNIATTERCRAELERDMWEIATTNGVVPDGRRKYLHKLTGTSAYKIEERCYLLNAGAASDVLWKRIEENNGMILASAVGRLRAAHEYATKNGTDLKTAVDYCLQEYDSWPLYTTRNGAKFRHQPPHSKVTIRAKRSRTAPRDIWQDIRSDVMRNIEPLLAGVDPLQAGQLQRDFTTAVQVLLDEFRGKVHRVKSRTNDNMIAIAFANVRAACTILAIDPPNRGSAVDLSAANKNKKRLAAQYHPDVAGVDKRERYEEVINAYATLEAYMEMLASNKSEITQ